MRFKFLKPLLWVGGIGTLLLLIMLAAAAFVLPAVVESRLIPGITAALGLHPRQFHVRRIGWWGADLGPIELAAGDIPVVSIAAVQIDYSPLSLIRGDIREVALGGVHLSLTVDDKGFAIPGLVLPPKAAAADRADTLPDLRTLLPVGLDRFSLRQSRVTLLWNRHRFSIPCEVILNTAGLPEGKLGIEARLAVLGNPLALRAKIDQQANTALLDVRGAQFLLDSLASTGTLPARVNAAGKIDLQARGRFQLDPFDVQLSCTAKIQETRITIPHARITNLTGGAPPMTIQLDVEGADTIRWSCAPFQIEAAATARIDKLAGYWTRQRAGWSLHAEAAAHLPAQNLAGGAVLAEALSLQWRAAASRSGQAPIELDIHATTNQPTVLRQKAMAITHAALQLSIQGLLADGRLTADAKAAVKGFQFQFPDGRLTVADPTIKGRLKLHPPDADAPSEVTARMVLPEVVSTLGTSTAQFPKIEIKAKGRSTPRNQWRFQAEVSAQNGLITNKPNAIGLQGISLRQPLYWPPPEQAQPGNFSIAAMQWRKRQLGHVKGSWRQQGRGMALNLRHQSKLFPDLIVLINGGMDETGMHIEAQLPAYRLAAETNLGRFHPAADGLLAAGRIQGHGRLELKDGSLHSAGYFKLDQGTVRDAAREMNFEGIAAEIGMDDLLAMKSGPRQKLRVDQLRFGDLTARSLAVDFQIEPGNILFIEKAGLQWCQGRINMAAIRVIPDKDDYDVTLFCDRLNLAMVLDQLGAAEASGEGSVNGRIPLRWTGGRLSFDNGFLYSTPGQTGAIQLTGTEALLSGLPPGTPQHTQLDIATEALKDYTYKWAKLAITSEDENLVLKLQFDGKPNRRLPFAYDKSLGQFKRVAGQGQADFKGISIDLNFTSPLNDIIDYKAFLKRN